MRQAAGLRPAACYVIQHNAGLTWPALLRLHAGHGGDGAGRERTRLTHGSPGIAPRFDGFSRSQHRPAEIRHEGEEEGAAGTMVRR